MTKPTSSTIQISPLTSAHAARAAALHVAGQPGTFLTALGADVLAVLYRVLSASPVGFGFVAACEDGAPLAFAAVTTSTGRLFVEMGTRRLPTLLPPLLTRFARQPSLIVRSVQTVIYPFLAHDDAGDGGQSVAELLSIMTDPAARGQGLGAALIAAVIDACRRRRIALLDVTVDAANLGARRFYERHGFHFRREFVLYGRAMALYRLPLEVA